MIAIAIYWLIGAFVFINLGKMVDRILGLKENPFFFSFLNGLFLFLIYFSFAAFFVGAFDFKVHLGFALLIIFSIWSNIGFFYNKISNWLESGEKKHPKYIIAVFFLFLFLSAQTPYLKENDIYYIQTIKWAGEYGMTKGLINLHPSLGEFSTWHILQAGVNPGIFIFNDLNGLLLLMYFLYLVCKLCDLKDKEFFTFDDRLLIFYFFIFPALLVFINSPSPDLPVIILSQVALYLFVRNFYHVRRDEFIELVIVVLFAASIKTTAIPLLMLPLLILIKYKKIIKKRDFLYYFLSVLVLFGFLMYKNYIITGYPFFPFSLLGEQLNADWRSPLEIFQNYINSNKAFMYGGKISSSSIVNLFHWIFQRNFITFIINFIWFATILLFPLTVLKHSHKKALISLYFVALIYFFILFFHFPFIKYFLYFEFLFLAIFLDIIFSPKATFRTIKYGIFQILAMGLFLFIIHKKNPTMIYNPMSFTKFTKYDSQIKKDVLINYPVGKNLFWETGDAFLPAAQPQMLDSILKVGNRRYKLQLRTNDLKDGFYLQLKNELDED